MTRHDRSLSSAGDLVEYAEAAAQFSTSIIEEGEQLYSAPWKR
ncbi:MAG: hypothetical protein AB4352_20625 [Hormoscilla sp.]